MSRQLHKIAYAAAHEQQISVDAQQALDLVQVAAAAIQAFEAWKAMESYMPSPMEGSEVERTMKILGQELAHAKLLALLA